MWSSLPDELVLCILRMIHDGALPTVTRLDKRFNGFTRERLSSLRRLTEEPFNVNTSCIFAEDVRFNFCGKLKNDGLLVIVTALSKGALDHLTVRWRPAALFPCLETWQVHSPD